MNFKDGRFLAKLRSQEIIYQELELIDWLRRSPPKTIAHPATENCCLAKVTSEDANKTARANSALLQNAELLPARQLAWQRLQNKWLQCRRCALSATRKHLVLGVGSLLAKIMFIGEAPGEKEDLKGEPFVGRAGQLLEALLRSIQLKRHQIFITNILKCRPPQNRDPLPREIAHCTSLLGEQIELIQPQILVAIGRIAAHYLLDTSASMHELRGRWFTYSKTQTPLLVTYHPAYLLRAPGEKRKAYQDFLRLKHRLA